MGDNDNGSVTSLEIPPELLEFLKDDPSYIICPNCNNVWENAGAGNENDCIHVKTDNGKLLSAECRKHYTQHRFRCHRCEQIFCSSCKRIPYHLGFTCDSFIEAMNAYKCRWCKEPISEDSLASKGPPKNPNKLVCSKCVDKDTACMSRDHPLCGHAAIWHHSMPTRKLADCIHPDCVKKRLQDSKNRDIDTITSEDFCNICWVEELGESPCLKLNCGHIFHAHCIKKKLRLKWEAGGPVSLSFMECPLCKAPINWPAICQPFVNELRELQEMRADLKLRCLQQINKIEKPKHISIKDDNYEERMFDYVMHKLNFYECFKCKSFYYGGKKECDQEANNNNNTNNTNTNNNNNNNEKKEEEQEDQNEEQLKLLPEELICGGCRGSCDKHGTEQMVYKCRFCCSVASYFCFGHTHFCKECHAKPWNIVSQNNYQFIVGNIPECPGPKECPLGIEHPPNGEEYVLGCAFCGEFVHLPNAKASVKNEPIQGDKDI